MPGAGPVPTSPANNDFKPGFSTALMNKDLGLAMDAVAATGATAPLGSHAADIYAKFAADHADLDFSAVIHTLRASRRISAHFDTKLGAYASARPQRSPAHPSALGGVFRVRQPRQ